MAVDTRADGEAAARARMARIQEVAMLLRAILGPELVASIGGGSPGRVAGWVQGRSAPSEVGELRMRVVLELLLLVMEAEGLEAARAWLSRRDPALQGRSPLGVLGQERPRQARRTLLAAARASVRGRRAGDPVVPLGQGRRSA
jgi:hypothetical protein